MASSRASRTRTEEEHLRLAQAIFLIYQRNCKVHNRFWGITVAEVSQLIKECCHYCNRKPANFHRGWCYSGIDRKDNRQGYVTGNCVACCQECNAVKGNRLTYEEMLVVGKSLREHRSKK